MSTALWIVLSLAWKLILIRILCKWVYTIFKSFNDVK